MKIIQSFAQFEEGNPYINNKDDSDKQYLNFYTFLLSFITLHKYYNHVTMFCNKLGYDTLIKYIPYDEIIIMENIYSFDMWSVYKIQAIDQMKEDFIHVDSDVFIFDDLFKVFIHNDYYDGIIQDTLPVNIMGVNDFVDINYKYLLEHKIIKSNVYDGRCYSCGVLGLKYKYKEEYIEIVHKLIKGFKDNKLLTYKNLSIPMIVEELGMYMFCKNNNLQVYNVLPFDLMEKIGKFKTGDVVKYTHMWFGNKFKYENVELITNKIKKDFSQYTEYIEQYELENKTKLKNYLQYKTKTDLNDINYLIGVGESILLDKNYI